MSNLLFLLWPIKISCEKIKAMDTLKYRHIEKKPAISDFVSSEHSDTTWGKQKLLMNELTPSHFTVFFLDASLHRLLQVVWVKKAILDFSLELS